jgi:hypothetical protein
MTRTARCTYYRTCGAEAPSDRKGLAFFQDKSQPQPGCAAPGTNGKGQCGYTEGAHELARNEPNRTYIKHLRDHEFVAQTQGEPYDEFYCGCHGWD